MVLKAEINHRLTDARTQVRAILPQTVDDETARRILAKYAAAIEGNFVSWMGATAITARSVQGRYAASENLWVEMKDDHAGMLRKFVESAGAQPNQIQYQEVAHAVGSVRAMVAEMSGLKDLALMAFLENTSAEFIPFLRQLAAQTRSTNLTYADVHGEADAIHADQFAWALAHECEHYEKPLETIDAVFQQSQAFLKSILTV